MTYTTTYEYDKIGNLTSLTYPSGSAVGYQYDSLGRVSLVTLTSGAIADTLMSDIQYAPLGAPEQWTLGNGIELTNRFDTRYLLDSISTGADSLTEWRYTYNAVRNITAIADLLDSIGTREFQYDDLNRLIQARSLDYPDSLMQYIYSRNGNRDTVIVYGISGVDTLLYTYDRNRLTQIAGTDTVTLVYDTLGNTVMEITGVDTTVYTYDATGYLVAVDSGLTAEYAYDGSARRIKKTTPVDTLKFITNGSGQILGVHDNSGVWQYDIIYVHGRPLAMVTGGETPQVLYYLTDHLGTPMALTDDQKTVRWSAKYYPYGELYSEYASATNELRFPGQWHDRENGLYYNWHRYYDPSTGRYLQADPIGLAGGANLYAYVGNNPISRTDRMGLDWYEMPNGDLMWSDPGSDFVGPMGRWYASNLRYASFADNGTLQFETIDPKRVHYFIPNATDAFLVRVKQVNRYARAQRAVGLFSESLLAASMWVYLWKQPCDLENSVSIFRDNEFVRLFGQVVENDDPGNMLFGYGASAAGYSRSAALISAGVIQVLTDFYHGDPLKATPTLDAYKDIYWILRGIEYYHMRNK